MELTENWAQTLIDNAGHSIYITDEEGTIQYVNPAFEEMTGYSREEVIGENPNILQSGKHSEEFYDELWSTILAGETWHSEIINRRKTGELYYADQTISPIEDSTGTIEGFVAINVDITERKKKNNFIDEMYSRIEEEHRHISRELHDRIGHDILFALMKLRGRMKEVTDREEKDALDTVVDVLDQAVDQLRNLSSLLRPPSIDKEGLKEILTLYSERIETQYDVDIEVESIGNPDRNNPGKETRQALYRVTQEAVINALEHGEPDRITILLTRQNQHLSLLIEDNGSGFDTEELDRASLREKVGIVGMRERTRLLNGTFTIESAPRTGTRVKVDIPLTSPSPVTS